MAITIHMFNGDNSQDHCASEWPESDSLHSLAGLPVSGRSSHLVYLQDFFYEGLFTTSLPVKAMNDYCALTKSYITSYCHKCELSIEDEYMAMINR